MNEFSFSGDFSMKGAVLWKQAVMSDKKHLFLMDAVDFSKSHVVIQSDSAAFLLTCSRKTLFALETQLKVSSSHLVLCLIPRAQRLYNNPTSLSALLAAGEAHNQYAMFLLLM